MSVKTMDPVIASYFQYKPNTAAKWHAQTQDAFDVVGRQTKDGLTHDDIAALETERLAGLEASLDKLKTISILESRVRLLSRGSKTEANINAHEVAEAFYKDPDEVPTTITAAQKINKDADKTLATLEQRIKSYMPSVAASEKELSLPEAMVALNELRAEYDSTVDFYQGNMAESISDLRNLVSSDQVKEYARYANEYLHPLASVTKFGFVPSLAHLSQYLDLEGFQKVTAGGEISPANILQPCAEILEDSHPRYSAAYEKLDELGITSKKYPDVFAVVTGTADPALATFNHHFNNGNIGRETARLEAYAKLAQAQASYNDNFEKPAVKIGENFKDLSHIKPTGKQATVVLQEAIELETRTLFLQNLRQTMAEGEFSTAAPGRQIRLNLQSGLGDLRNMSAADLVDTLHSNPEFFAKVLETFADDPAHPGQRVPVTHRTEMLQRSFPKDWNKTVGLPKEGEVTFTGTHEATPAIGAVEPRLDPPDAKTQARN